MNSCSNTQSIETKTAVLDGITLSLYTLSKKSVPLIVEIDHGGQGASLLELCKKKGCRDFSLMSISGISWDEDLSPWFHAPCVTQDDHFTGQAGAFLAWIERSALPWVFQNMNAQPLWTGIAGYSMGGLFAVYAGIKSTCFSRIICVSGSLWYPDFEAWALKTPFLKKPVCIYLSLGDKEPKTSNPLLQHTGDVMQHLADFWKEEGIETLFEWNSGNHFQDPSGRMAKGIKWALLQGADQKK